MSRLNRTQVVLAVLLIASVAFLSVSLRGGRPTHRHRAATAPGEAATAATTSRAEPQLRPAAPQDTDFRRYASLESSTIFSETRNAPSPPPGARNKVLPPPPLHLGPPPKPIERGPDLAGWSYVGYVRLDGVKLGVLQNDATGTVSFLGVGDTFMGAEVESLDRESIRLSAGSSSTTLSRPADFPVKPLERGPGAPGGPQPPQPAQPKPGQPPGR